MDDDWCTGSGRGWGACRCHKGRQVTFPSTANGLDKPMVLPSFRTACHCHPVFIAQHTKAHLLCCSVKLNLLIIPQLSQPVFPDFLQCLPLAPKRQDARLPPGYCTTQPPCRTRRYFSGAHLPASDLPQSFSSFLQSNPKLVCAPQRAAVEAVRSGKDKRKSRQLAPL